MSVNISLSGVEKIDRVLKGLPNQLTHNFLSEVHTIAAQPFVQRAKLLAPIGETMNLTRSIGTEKESYGRSDTLGIVRAGVRRGRFKGNHGHLIEFGTKTRTTREGANRGFVRPHPFERPALSQTKKQIENIIAYQVSRKIVGYMRSTLNG